LKAFLPAEKGFWQENYKKSSEIAWIVITKSHFSGDFFQKVTFCKKQAGSRIISPVFIEAFWVFDCQAVWF